ncbi:hypothetical protein GFS31_23660 [Leptolyngbya sp. BL0902]|nr:hypothetical protein GFS31_23660 [Leptolyngbya sp. BL0902]
MGASKETEIAPYPRRLPVVFPASIAQTLANETPGGQTQG